MVGGEKERGGGKGVGENKFITLSTYHKLPISTWLQEKIHRRVVLMHTIEH